MPVCYALLKGVELDDEGSALLEGDEPILGSALLGGDELGQLPSGSVLLQGDGPPLDSSLVNRLQLRQRLLIFRSRSTFHTAYAPELDHEKDLASLRSLHL